MAKVAEFAKEMGWKMPKPPSDVEMLAQLFAADAQAEQKYDNKPASLIAFTMRCQQAGN